MVIVPINCQENIRFGILLMFAYSLLALITDSFAKRLVLEVTINQVVWARFFFHTIALIICFGPIKFFQLSRTRNVKLQVVRSLLMIATAFLFFSGIGVIDLATAHSIFFLAPILVTVLSIPILGERIGIRRLFGVCSGFIGALLIIRPGYENFSAESFYFVGAAITAALYQLATRRLGHTDHAHTTLYYTAALGTIISSLVVWLDWQPVQLMSWGLMIALGTSAALGHFFLIKAFQMAPASALMPFTYSSLIWALILGYSIFNELPDQQTFFGAAIIIGSGLYIYIRERAINLGRG
ncbi:MAG: hypothetical protein CBB68_00585 [Rhodospirillaceae bacterium TMED8]|nr:hypothetical protein [Magnetovibrio sp.]OUT53381.1 MAG: hypothetical protein CBB68_00585 [Rhodospirillaceae bacterium TMED8]